MKDLLLREWQIYQLAVSIFTRIPVPASVPYSEARKNESYKYCGLVGLLVGLLTALVFSMSAYLWPAEVAVVLSMAFSIYITGAFHEDGFADTCDGLGGGFTPERKMEIMKDSRVGAYGLLGMILILLLKYTTLISLSQVPLALIIAHVLSRSMAVSFIHTHGYVRQSEQSKLKVARSPTQQSDLVSLIVVALLVSLFILTFKAAVTLCVALMLARLWFARWMVKQVGGYTGDVLGAVQQLTEVLCYLVLLAV
jgi:adenosylcobinamide-GDP ribazoletransferase